MLQSPPKTTSRDTFFHRELERLGPVWASGSASPQRTGTWPESEALAYCRMWAKRQYENFTVVSFLLPKKFRQDFYNVYAYCRWADNLADEIDEPDQSLQLLDWWRDQLSRCYSGHPDHPVLIALQITIEKYGLPIEPFADLLQAFRQDQRVTRYASEEELLEYCRCSANPVGRILLFMAGVRDADAICWSDQICTGLQLANFCQDMSRDATRGRIYAPRTLWEKHHVTESALLGGVAKPELRSLLTDWVVTSRGYLEAGRPLVERVPSWLATDVDLFVRGGLAILNSIEAQDYDVWTRRPTVSKFQKLLLFGRSFLRHLVNHSTAIPRHRGGES